MYVVVEAAAAASKNEDALVEMSGILRFIAGFIPGGKDAVTDAVATCSEDARLEGLEGAQRLRVADTLLSNLGGNRALKLLSSRASIGEKFAELARSADEKVRAMFDKSLVDARTGFHLALIMDFILFAAGIALLFIAMATGIVTGKDGGGGGSGMWIGTVVSGGMGASAVASSLYQSPRFQIKAATNHSASLNT